MKTTDRAEGFTLVEIMIVVAIIGLLAAIALPNFLKVRRSSQASACINNLRQIDGAKHQWALEMGKKGSETPETLEIKPYLGRGDEGELSKVHCPIVAGGGELAGYQINPVTTPPQCLNFNDLEHPAQMNY